MEAESEEGEVVDVEASSMVSVCTLMRWVDACQCSLLELDGLVYGTNWSRVSSAALNASSADLASAFRFKLNFAPVSNFLPAVPPCASASASLMLCSVCSSSVNGAFDSPEASCFVHPSLVNSLSSVTNILSRKRSVPKSLVNVSRVDANSIFCRTGAVSGTYVTATKPSGAFWYRRRMI